MSESTKRSNSLKYFFLLILFIAITDISFVFNIPVLRQITGFTFLTFLPGLLLIHILKLDKLKSAEKFVFAIGLSIALLMIIGLLMNSVYPLLGYDTPLSSKSLLITFSIIIFILGIFAYLRNRSSFVFSLDEYKLNTREKLYLLLPIIFPLLAIIGMRIMNDTSNNLILVALLLAIAGYSIFLAAKRNQISDRIHVPIIFLMSISLVLPLALRSNHIIGADINSEYYIFQQTLQNARWQPVMHNILDSCLSISILPSIYQSFLMVNSEYLFKILYPVIFSIAPVVVYLITRKYLGSFFSFLASLFFMSQVSFLGAEMSPRTTIALLFVAFTIMTLFYKGLRTFESYLLFIIFSTTVILSHYTTAFIFLVIVFFTWAITQLSRLVFTHRKTSMKIIDKDKHVRIENNQPKSNIMFGMIAFYFIMIYFWDRIVSVQVYEMFVTFTKTTYNSVFNFFDVQSRGPGALILGSGLNSQNIPQRTTFIFSWLTIIFIAIGVIATIVRFRKATTIYPDNSDSPPEFILQKFDAEFFVMALVCCLLLVIVIAVPYILVGYDIDRVYILAMIVLVPFFVIGGIVLSNVINIFIHKKLTYLIILLVLISYFMCNAGLINQAFDLPVIITLNSRGQEYDLMYIHDQETFAAKMISNYATPNAPVYSDYYGSSKLISQGGIPSAIYAGPLITEHEPLATGYFFLRYTGFVDFKLFDANLQWHDLSEYNDQFNYENIIYSNGGSAVYYVDPLELPTK